MKKVSLYNHKAIGSDEKPLMPNVVFKALMTLVRHRDFESAEFLAEKYTLHPFNKQLYEQIISGQKHRSN